MEMDVFVQWTAVNATGQICKDSNVEVVELFLVGMGVFAAYTGAVVLSKRVAACLARVWRGCRVSLCKWGMFETAKEQFTWVNSLGGIFTMQKSSAQG